MNTIVGQVTAYADNGPSLYEWLRGHPSARWSGISPNDYVSRATFGEYLSEVFAQVIAAPAPNVEVSTLRTEVTEIVRSGTEYVLALRDPPGRIKAHKIVLATGHPRNAPDEEQLHFVSHAERHKGLHYVLPDSPADLDLDRIGHTEIVGLRGMGLAFYDIVLALTVGRGGRFVRAATGELRYINSGREPRIVAGSRSGLPFLARGINKKEIGTQHEPVFLTVTELTRLREAARVRRGTPQLDFEKDVRPIVQLELELVYYATWLRVHRGDQLACSFRTAFAKVAQDRSHRESILTEFGLDEVLPLDLNATTRPFRGLRFNSPQEFRFSLERILRCDISEARKGNIDSPLKAALDAMRDLRPTLREIVNFSGLLPASQRDHFVNGFSGLFRLASTGPPLHRVEQLLALIEEGVVCVVGPSMKICVSHEVPEFMLFSPQVASSACPVGVLIEARTAEPDVHRNASPLFRQMLHDGIATEHINSDPATGDRFETGGLAVTPAHHVINASGVAITDLYCIGPPTENLRWYTFVAPGVDDSYFRDAEAIASDILKDSPAISSHSLDRK
jgi:methylaspartate mutase epsilon subunit